MRLGNAYGKEVIITLSAGTFFDERAYNQARISRRASFETILKAKFRFSTPFHSRDAPGVEHPYIGCNTPVIACVTKSGLSGELVVLFENFLKQRVKLLRLIGSHC